MTVRCVVWCAQRDRDKITELKQQLVKIAKREELARKELVEQKKSADAVTSGSVEKLTVAQKEKQELAAALDKVDLIISLLGYFSFRYNRAVHWDTAICCINTNSVVVCPMQFMALDRYKIT